MTKAFKEHEITVYVKLLHEGVDVWRPVKALETDRANVCCLLAPTNGVPASETWEFLPGTEVFVEQRVLDGEKQFVATKKADKSSR